MFGYIQVVVKRAKRSSIHHLTRSLKGIGKSVGRRNPSGIAKQVCETHTLPIDTFCGVSEFLFVDY